MRVGSGRAICFALVVAGALASCSLGSLDDLGANSGKDAGFDAVFEGPIDGGQCVLNKDCTGCDTCMSWCACVAPNQAEKCLDACLGSDGGGTGGGGGSGGSGTGATGGVGGGGTSGGTGGVAGDGGSTSGGAPGGGGAGAGGSGTGGTPGGGGAPTGGGGAGATGGTSGVGTIACAGSTCPVAQQFCCVDQQQGSVCKSLSTGCAGSKVRCDGPEDCQQGLVCCGKLNGAQTEFNDVSCDNGTCDASYQRVFCHVSADCPAPKSCVSSAVVPGFKVCQ